MPHRYPTIPGRRAWPKSPAAESSPLARPATRMLTRAYLTPMTNPAAQPRTPVILTVDDDPAVSRAVARDLRRKYGEKHRIVRAESGQDALETLNQLKLRGEA